MIFLYGDSLFGTDVTGTGYGAPATGYGGTGRALSWRFFYKYFLIAAPEASYGAPAPSYGAPEPSYGAPAPSYGAPAYAAQRYYVSRTVFPWGFLNISVLLQDPYAANAASSLGAEVYSPELNPYNIAQEAAVAAEGRKWFLPPSLPPSPTSNIFFLLTNISLTNQY